jgi:GntR family transcriptional regulator
MSMPAGLVRAPVYQQLNDQLRQQLKSAAPGTRFLTEREISEHYAVSRATANKALAGLVGEGLLEFRKGVGTFVRPVTLAYDLQHLMSFTAQAVAAGKTPSTRVLAFALVAAAGPDIGAALGADAGPLWRIERLRLVDGRPTIVETRHVPERFCPGLTASDCAGSIYDLWRDRYHLRLGGAEQTITAIAADAHEASLLQVPGGAPLLCTEAVGHLADGSALWHERTRYHADGWKFRIRLGAPGSGPPGDGPRMTLA